MILFLSFCSHGMMKPKKRLDKKPNEWETTVTLFSVSSCLAFLSSPLHQSFQSSWKQIDLLTHSSCSFLSEAFVLWIDFYSGLRCLSRLKRLGLESFSCSQIDHSLLLFLVLLPSSVLFFTDKTKGISSILSREQKDLKRIEPLNQWSTETGGVKYIYQFPSLQLKSKSLELLDNRMEERDWNVGNIFDSTTIF